MKGKSGRWKKIYSLKIVLRLFSDMQNIFVLSKQAAISFFSPSARIGWVEATEIFDR